MTGPVSVPILGNMNNYPILVKTPCGRWISMAPQTCVKGNGFERYIANKSLFPVSESYGPILYETPEVVTFVSGASTEPAPIPKEEKTMGSVNEQDVMSAQLDSGKKSIGLEQLSRNELSQLATKLGLKADGSRIALLSRLTPISDKVDFSKYINTEKA